RFAGEPALRIGDLDAGLDHARARAYLDAEHRARAGDCATCWARAHCAGGCHYENHQRERVLAQPRGASCDFIRGWTALGLEVYAGLRRDGPVLAFIDRRAHGDGPHPPRGRP
ncbi:MAG TPA: SPASM domain-containing protein, partial [Casimicrobiaceae bacterium]|nr:SPASM domain-containing protein [Casimicrobiaceae bacterium]